MVFAPDAQVPALGDAAGHEAARAIGRRHRADLVVWGAARCDESSCVLPRFTVVDPERLYSPDCIGEQLPVDHTRMKLTAAELPPEPMALAAALLGDLAWRAQGYPDAVYYLDRALSGAAYRGEDDLKARWRLARAANLAGQWTRARAEAAALAADADARGVLDWSLSAELELVALDISEGKPANAQARAERVLTRARAGGDAHREAYALSWLGDLAGRRGDAEAALTHLRTAAALTTASAGKASTR